MRNHAFVSRGFFWADDSSSFVFADRMNGSLSVILVSVEGNTFRSYSRVLSPKDICDDPAKWRTAYPILADARITSWPNHSHDVYVDIDSGNAGCSVRGAAITSKDFEPAKVSTLGPGPKKKPAVMIHK